MARLNRLLLGGVIGAGLALLFSPKSGREIRRMLTGGGRKALPAYSGQDYVDFPVPAEEKALVAQEAAGPEMEMAEKTATAPAEDEIWEALSTPAEGEPTLAEALSTPAEGEPTLEREEPAAAAEPLEAAAPSPSGIDSEEIRRRIDETRARLKAKAFEARKNENEAAGRQEKAEPEA